MRCLKEEKQSLKWVHKYTIYWGVGCSRSYLRETKHFAKISNISEGSLSLLVPDSVVISISSRLQRVQITRVLSFGQAGRILQ